jgi:hypothetical protein
MRQRNKIDEMIAWELGDSEGDASFGIDILPTYVSTQDVYDYLDTVNTQIIAVQRDIQTNSAVITSDLKKNWSDFTDQWRPFYDKQHSTGHFWFIGSVMDEIDTYAAKLRSFQTQVNTILSANQVTPSAPDVNINKAQASAVASQKTIDIIKTGTTAAAVVIGGVLLFKIFDYLPKPRKTVQ